MENTENTNVELGGQNDGGQQNENGNEEKISYTQEELDALI